MNQILRVARMYYEMHLGQLEIGKRENISKSTVSRLLKNAEELGFVKITVEKPLCFVADLEEALVETFGLRRAVVIPDMVGDSDLLLGDVCRTAAEELPGYIKDNMTIAAAWGRTMNELVRNLAPMPRSHVKVVQINGGTSRLLYDTGVNHMIRKITEAVDGTGYLLPAPAVVDNVYIAEAIKSDSQIRSAINLAEQADIGLWSVGKVTRDSILYELMGFPDNEFSRIKKQAAGDVCSHYLNADGAVADESFDCRVVAVAADAILKIGTKILIVSGNDKAVALESALKGGFADVLYVDEPLARKVLKKAGKLTADLNKENRKETTK